MQFDFLKTKILQGENEVLQSKKRSTYPKSPRMETQISVSFCYNVGCIYTIIGNCGVLQFSGTKKNSSLLISEDVDVTVLDSKNPRS